MSSTHRYLRKDDLYVHADLHGAATTIVRNNDSTASGQAALRCASTHGLQINHCLTSLEVHHRLHRSNILQHHRRWSPELIRSPNATLRISPLEL